MRYNPDVLPPRYTRLWQDSQERIVEVDDDYDTTVNDDYVLVDTTSGAVDISLHTPKNGYKITIKRVAGANNVNVSGSETIDGSASAVVTTTPLRLKEYNGNWISI
jgi:hypothetical protein